MVKLCTWVTESQHRSRLLSAVLLLVANVMNMTSFFSANWAEASSTNNMADQSAIYVNIGLWKYCVSMSSKKTCFDAKTSTGPVSEWVVIVEALCSVGTILLLTSTALVFASIIISDRCSRQHHTRLLLLLDLSQLAVALTAAILLASGAIYFGSEIHGGDPVFIDSNPVYFNCMSWAFILCCVSAGLVLASVFVTALDLILSNELNWPRLSRSTSTEMPRILRFSLSFPGP